MHTCIGATIRIGREIQCLPYAGFFCSIFKKKNDFFFKNEQKKLGNYKNKHTIRIVGRFHGVLTRAEPNPYKNRVAE